MAEVPKLALLNALSEHGEIIQVSLDVIQANTRVKLFAILKQGISKSRLLPLLGFVTIS